MVSLSLLLTDEATVDGLCIMLVKQGDWVRSGSVVLAVVVEDRQREAIFYRTPITGRVSRITRTDDIWWGKTMLSLTTRMPGVCTMDLFTLSRPLF